MWTGELKPYKPNQIEIQPLEGVSISEQLEKPVLPNDLDLKFQELPENIYKQTVISPKYPTGTGDNSVYVGFTEHKGVVEYHYVGISNNLPRRFGEHWSSLTPKSNLDFRVVEGATGLSRIQARIIEQNLINSYKMQQLNGTLYNKINSIAPRYWNGWGIIISF